jgi:hypothetical protein
MQIAMQLKLTTVCEVRSLMYELLLWGKRYCCPQRNLANNFGGAKWTVGITNFNLRGSQVEVKGGDWFCFTFFCLYTTQIVFLKIFIFFICPSSI